MKGRWKYLPHRLSDGRCRDCGRLVASTAPDTCARCALERYGDQGFSIVQNPVAAFEQELRETWRILAQEIRAGQIPPNRFYVWVGHGDGGPLDRPAEDLDGGPFADATTAHEMAMQLISRYPQVWVVTNVGCWNVFSGI